MLEVYMPESTQLSTADRLRQNKETILQSWEEQVRKNLPGAKEKSTSFLRDELPRYIEEIAVALEHPGTAACGKSGVCSEHGQQRAYAEGYTFEQVADDYHLLRQTVLNILEVDGQLPQNERDCIFESIFNGIKQAGAEFSRLLIERERKIADELRKERDLRAEFVATLSHDLRNPLSAARASAHLIMRYGDKLDVRQKAVTRLTNSLERAEEMIADLLDSQRIRGGQKLQLKMEPIEINAMLEELVSDMKTVHGDRVVLITDGPIAGSWNEKNLRRAVENLTNNALRYGDPDGDVTLSVKQTEHDAIVSVHNFGNPIKPEDQQRIFEPFYRAPTHDKHFKGWGLGLLLVKGIAEAHHGRVELTSTPEKGTTFSIVLPKGGRS
jgi:signal transduction histidine kinase